MITVSNTTQLLDALSNASDGDTIHLDPGDYGLEGAAGDPIVINKAVTLKGAFAGDAGDTRSTGVNDESGTRSGPLVETSSTGESEINDPLHIEADGVTIDGVTFDVTANFFGGGDNELSGGGIVVDYASGTTITNSRFVETPDGSDVGTANQNELSTTAATIHGLKITDNAFVGGNGQVQIGGGAELTGVIDVTGNVVEDGNIAITPGLASTADITVAGNEITGQFDFGDFPFGINGAGFAADEVPGAVLTKLNDVADENTIDDGTLTFAGSEGDDDLTGFASTTGLQYFVAGDAGDDQIAGNDQDDELLGGGGDDEITGGAGDDVIEGDGNFAEQTGVAGDDTIEGGAGADHIDGNDGNDTVSYAGAPQSGSTLRIDRQSVFESGGARDIGLDIEFDGLIARMHTGEGEAGDAEGDVYKSVENIVGSDFNDWLTGTNAFNLPSGESEFVASAWHPAGVSQTVDNTIDGGDGDDFLQGGEGADKLRGGDGDDFLMGDHDDDELYGNEGEDEILGGDGDDEAFGGKDDDTIDGGEGDDELNGNKGDDTILGGLGDDTIHGNTGDDTLHGGDGDDELRGDDGSDEITGGDGDDLIYGGSEYIDKDDAGDTLDGGTGDDEMYGNAGDDEMVGGAGNDEMYGGEDDDDMSGGAGDDTLHGNKGADTISGGVGNDHIDGGDGGDFIKGDLPDTKAEDGDGDDTIHAGAGDDIVGGQGGNDEIDGGDGNDRLWGSKGNDVVSGGTGDDDIFGGHGDDDLHGDEGADEIFGDAGDDVIRGGAGDDGELAGGKGDDEIHGGDGDDLLRGDQQGGGANAGDGDDTIYGGAGDDIIGGQGGDDVIDGGAGNDRLWGSDGDDRLIGGTGSDELHGGEGIDVAVIADNGGTPLTDDQITDLGLTVDEGVISGTVDAGDGVKTLSGIEVVEIANTGSSTFMVMDTTSLLTALSNASDGDIIHLDPGDYGHEGAAGEPIVIDKAVTLEGAFAGDAGDTRSTGVNDQSGTRTGSLVVNVPTGESEINDPLHITVPGVTIDGVTFDVTANFFGGGDNELSGGGIVVDYASGTTITNSRFVETPDGSDVGTANQNELSTTAATIDGLTITDNAFVGGNGQVQIGGGAELTGDIDVTDNVVENGNIAITPGLDSTADITVAGNEITGQFDFGDFPFGINGTGFAADEVPDAVLTKLNDVAADNTIDGGTLTFAGSEGDDDLTVFASTAGLQYFVAGDAGDDHIAGNDQDDTLLGGGGDDEIIGGAGDDTIEGDGNFAGQTGVAGDDTIFGNQGDDDIVAGAGDDEVFGGKDNDTIDGGAGNDELNGNKGDDKLHGGDGDDELRGDDGSDEITGGDGDDLIYGGSEFIDKDDAGDTLDGGTGDDEMYGNAGNDEMDGGAGNDEMFGGEDADDMSGGAGDDTLHGNKGDDTISGGGGSDDLYGGNGDDFLKPGFGGDDEVKGGAGDDHVLLEGNVDLLDGGDGYDWLEGRFSRSELDIDLAATNFEKVWGSDDRYVSGGDVLDGSGVGADTDLIIRGFGNDDEITGGAGDDEVRGDGGKDTIEGGAGNDRLEGGAGNDFYTGGPGADTFFFAARNTTEVFTDFTPGVDTFLAYNALGNGFRSASTVQELNDRFSDVGAAVTDDGTDTTVDFGTNGTIVFEDLIL